MQVVNPQSRANGLENLARVFQVCVDLDLERQLFPFATPREVDAHVRGAKLNHDVPLENVEAVFATTEYPIVASEASERSNLPLGLAGDCFGGSRLAMTDG